MKRYENNPNLQYWWEHELKERITNLEGQIQAVRGVAARNWSERETSKHANQSIKNMQEEKDYLKVCLECGDYLPSPWNQENEK